MALQGSLDTVGLTDVLALLGRAATTGLLSVDGDDRSGRVWFQGGAITAVMAGRHRRALDPVDGIFELLRIESGTFSFDDMAGPIEGPAGEAGAGVVKQADLGAVVAAAEQRMIEWRDIQAVVGPPESQVTLLGGRTDPVTVSADEWETVLAIGASATVDDVVERRGLGEFEGCRAVKVLVEAGLAAVTRPPAAPSPLEAAVRPSDLGRPALADVGSGDPGFDQPSSDGSASDDADDGWYGGDEVDNGWHGDGPDDVDDGSHRGDGADDVDGDPYPAGQSHPALSMAEAALLGVQTSGWPATPALTMPVGSDPAGMIAVPPPPAPGAEDHDEPAGSPPDGDVDTETPAGLEEPLNRGLLLSFSPRSGPEVYVPTTANGAKALSEDEQLGHLLVAGGLLSAAALTDALAERDRLGTNLSRILIDDGLVSETDLVASLAAHLGLRFVDLSEEEIDQGAVTLISDSLARRHSALPIGWSEGRLVVAMADPSNVFAIDDIRNITKTDVRPVVATRAAIQAAISRYHRADTDAEDITAAASVSFGMDDDLAHVREVVEDAPIVKLVNLMILQAIIERASDIHIEPGEDDVRVRYRIDGVLHEAMRPPKNIQAAIISRLKVMAEMNIAERRVPQDGRVTTTIDGHSVDLRVATLPTVHGEKIVMRVLDKSNAVLRLSDLGFLPDNMERYARSYQKPYGTILVTGPTGSGKSTTLYATLNILNDEAKNVITVEDPVEYQLAGINQVQVNVKAGLTFAAALRSILRSDPDIVLVGEIRDRETATIAIEAALTGHLVLTTLHTNDAASTPSRLVEMGVEPFLVGSAIDCIVAQRLARRLCEKCRQPYTPDPSELEQVGWDFFRLGGLDAPLTLYRPVGCGVCSRTGYHGRLAVHEVLNVNEEVERLIVERGHSEDIRKAALASGMITLREAGLIQVANGLTSIEEVLRVIA